MGKKKVPKTPEQRAAKEEIMAAKRKLKVKKKETQCLKVLQKAAKKAKDFQLAKLRRRLKPFILARAEENGQDDKPTEGSSSRGETKDAVTLLPGKSEADKPAAAKQEAHEEQDVPSEEEEGSSEGKSESRKESDSSSDEEAESSSDDEADAPPTPAPSQQEAIKVGKKGNKRKQMEMQVDVDAKPASKQATPKKKRKGGNGMGEVLPAEDNGPNLSEDATPQNENAAGQLIKASNSELQDSKKKRDPLKYETSNEDAIRRQMEVGKKVSNHAVAILAGQKLGMFLVKEEVPDLRLDPDIDEAAVQAELRPFAERMLAHAAMKRALEECKEVVDKVHAVQERWETRGERRAAKAARRAAAQAERAAQGLPEKSDGDGASQNAKQRKEAARKAKREARLMQKEITREKKRKEFKLQQAAISRGDGSVKYLKPYQQKRIAKEQAAQGMLPNQKRNKAKYGGGKGGKRDKKKEAGAPTEATRSADNQKSGNNAGLHPSWAAKKQQSDMMGHLPKAQGKKVVFDD